LGKCPSGVLIDSQFVINAIRESHSLLIRTFSLDAECHLLESLAEGEVLRPFEMHRISSICEIHNGGGGLVFAPEEHRTLI